MSHKFLTTHLFFPYFYSCREKSAILNFHDFSGGEKAKKGKKEKQKKRRKEKKKGRKKERQKGRKEGRKNQINKQTKLTTKLIVTRGN